MAQTETFDPKRYTPFAPGVNDQGRAEHVSDDSTRGRQHQVHAGARADRQRDRSRRGHPLVHGRGSRLHPALAASVSLAHRLHPAAADGDAAPRRGDLEDARAEESGRAGVHRDRPDGRRAPARSRTLKAFHTAGFLGIGSRTVPDRRSAGRGVGRAPAEGAGRGALPQPAASCSRSCSRRSRSTSTAATSSASRSCKSLDAADRLLRSPSAKAFDLSLEPKRDVRRLQHRAASARAACWRGGWSKPARATSRSRRSTSRSSTGTRTRTATSAPSAMKKLIDAPIAQLDSRPRRARAARSHAGRPGQRVRPRRDHRRQGRQGGQGSGDQHPRRHDRAAPLRHAPALHRRRLDPDVRRRHQEGVRLRQDRRRAAVHDDREPGRRWRICTRRSITRSAFAPDTVLRGREAPGLRDHETARASRSSTCSRSRSRRAPIERQMKTTRREFLAAAAAAPVLSPILLGTQDKAGHEGARPRHRRATRTRRIHDWGELPPHIKWGNTHGVVEDSQGNIYVHHTVHATSESADSMVVFDAKGKFVRSWGKEFRGVAHGLHIRKEGTRRVPVPDGQRREPADDAAARDAGGRDQDDAEGGDRLEDPGAAGRRRVPARARTARRNATTRPTSPSRPTATSTSATATARPSSISTTARREYIRTLRRARVRARTARRAARHLDRHALGASPILVVADRRNNRLQRFTLDGTAHRLRPGLPAAVPLPRAQGHSS